jgi:protocatechuate 3,4-dioxygenase, alpha subunit
MTTYKNEGIASQTIGPFFHNGLKWEQGNRIVGDAGAVAVTVYGKVRDGAGAVVTDAMIEMWAADSDGSFSETANAQQRPRGFARIATDAEGVYRVHAFMPSHTSVDGKRFAPHLNVVIFARGLLTPLFTRVYFAPLVSEIAFDPIIAAIDDEARAATLLAVKIAPNAYQWDVQLQGDGETVFLTRD